MSISAVLGCSAVLPLGIRKFLLTSLVVFFSALCMHAGDVARTIRDIAPGNLYPQVTFESDGKGIYTFTITIRQGYALKGTTECRSPNNGWHSNGGLSAYFKFPDDARNGNLADFFSVHISGTIIPVGPGVIPPPEYQFDASGLLSGGYYIKPPYMQVDLDQNNQSSSFAGCREGSAETVRSLWLAQLVEKIVASSGTASDTFSFQVPEPGRYKVTGTSVQDPPKGNDSAQLDAYKLDFDFNPPAIAIGTEKEIGVRLLAAAGFVKNYTFSVNPLLRAKIAGNATLALDNNWKKLKLAAMAPSIIEDDTAITNFENNRKVPFSIIKVDSVSVKYRTKIVTGQLGRTGEIKIPVKRAATFLCESNINREGGGFLWPEGCPLWKLEEKPQGASDINWQGDGQKNPLEYKFDKPGQYIFKVICGTSAEKVKVIVGDFYNVDLQLVEPDVPEALEESVGGFVMVNDDDDNGDLNVDRYREYEKDAFEDKELRKITIECDVPEVSLNYPVLLHLNSLGGIKLWKNSSRKGDPIGFGYHKYTSELDIPSELFIEGVNPSEAVISLAYSHPELKEPLKDAVKISAIENNIMLDGLQDEKTVRENGKILRIEPYEYSSGAVLIASPVEANDCIYTLWINKPKGGELPKDSEVILEWPSEYVKIYDPVLDDEECKSPYKVKVSELQSRTGQRKQLRLALIKPTEKDSPIVVDSKYTAPDGTLCEDKLKIRSYLFDLDIDSGNMMGIKPPKESKEEDDMEDNDANEFGKFVFVNHNDDNNNGIVDYADLTNNDKSFIPLVITISDNFVLKNLKLKLSYPGLKEMPDKTKFEGKKVVFDYKDYKDYAGVKEGVLRVWLAEDLSKERKLNDVLDGGNYITPNKDYMAEKLFGNKRKITLYVEGVNVTNKPVKLILNGEYDDNGNKIEFKDTVRVTVVEGDIGVNTTNDVTFNIDDKDDMIEDQNDGFVFWKSRDVDEKITEMGIIDVFPVKVTVPQVLYNEGWEFYIAAESDSKDAAYDLYKNYSSEENRILYLQDSEFAKSQLSAERISKFSSKPQRLRGINDWTMLSQEYLIKALAEGKSRLILCAKTPMSENYLELDSIKLAINSDKSFFHAVSTRGMPNNLINYPTEDGRQVKNYNVYPTPIAMPGYGGIDSKKEKIFLFIHGYNVSKDGVESYWPEIYKRFYWTGFRNNLIVLAWEGDEFSMPVIPTPYFGSNMENALQTSWPVSDYIRNLKIQYPKQEIDASAHSLGNLVLMDALRILHVQYNKKYINNVLHTEPAVWKETLDPRSGFVDNGFAYSVIDQQKISWRHWLLNYSQSVSGNTYNSYNSDDYVLKLIMRFWQAKLAPSRNNLWEKNRSERLVQYRTPYLLWHDIPGWPIKMEERERALLKLEYDEIQIPMGANGNVKNTVNIDAYSLGWRWTMMDFGHSSWEVLPYYNIYKWYNDVMVGKMKVTGN